MFYIYMLATVLVFGIGAYMVKTYYPKGWATPPVLSGIAFILLTAPIIVALLLSAGLP
ncbi:MAG TPA: hypothetical protein PK539_04665 [Candidatus Paceibacterota bacterium]|nr:hypothetical protein [Candidatus Paceibacterota bacterium]